MQPQFEVDGRTVAAARLRASPPWATAIIGEAPSRISDPHQPLLGGRSGRFLAQLAGLEPYQFGFLFRLLNLLPTMPSEARKRALLRAAGGALTPHLAGRRVIVLGRHVADGIGIASPFLEWTAAYGGEMVILPHPSGRATRVWTEEMRRDVATLLREEAVRGAEGVREAMKCLPPAALMPWLDRLRP